MVNRTAKTLAAALAAAVVLAGNAGAFDDPVPVCGDVNDSGAVTSSDALAVLKVAVGQPNNLDCEECPQPEDLGYPDDLGLEVQLSPNFLLGNSLEIPANTVITHLGVLGKAAGPHVQLGLYTDNGGSPDQLVTATGTEVLAAKQNWFPATPVEITAGTYWLMGVYDASALIGYTTSDPSAVVKYRNLTFNGTLPTTFGSAFSFTGATYNYYAHGIQ